MTTQLPVEQANYFFDVVHADEEMSLDFGDGTDIVHRVWFEWTNPGFLVSVETFRFMGTVSAIYLQPTESRWGQSEDTYHLIKAKDISETLLREHGIDLAEALQ